MIKILTNLEKHMCHVRNHWCKLVHCTETAGLCHQYQRVPSNHFGKLCRHLCCKCNWLPSESGSIIQICYLMPFQNSGKMIKFYPFKVCMYIFTFRFSGWHGWLSISKGVNIPWLPVLKHRPMKIILVANILTQFLWLKWHLKQND